MPTLTCRFSLADFHDAGVSVVTVGCAHDEAQRAADELARAIWQERDGFVYASTPLADSVAEARRLKPRAGGRPVLLLDVQGLVAAAAIDEDVDAVGLSMLSGAHTTLALTNDYNERLQRTTRTNERTSSTHSTQGNDGMAHAAAAGRR